ncbi:Trypsin [compost metagenome]
MAKRITNSGAYPVGGFLELSKLLMMGIISSLSLTACSPGNPSDIKGSYDSIVGGSQVLFTDKIRTSIVGVYDDAGGQLCTGTLIAENIVITAAHCIGFSTEDMYIIFDTVITSKSPRRKVDTVEVSPYWTSRRYEDKDRGDLAIIRFLGSRPQGYKPARFLSGPENVANGVETVVAGYGYNNAAAESGAGTLRQTSVVIADTLFSTTEVLIDQTTGKGSCHGDSGGPAFLEIKGEFFLWGVTARGVGDVNHLCNTYSAFTNLAAHKNWVNRMLKRLSKPINSIDIR